MRFDRFRLLPNNLFNLVVVMITISLISSCGQKANQTQYSVETGLSVERFNMNMHAFKEMHNEKDFASIGVEKELYISQLIMAAKVSEAQQRGLEVTHEETIERLEEINESMNEHPQTRDLHELQEQIATDYLGVSSEQYQDEYVLPYVKQTILRDKLRDEVVPHDVSEEHAVLIPEWGQFIYDLVLSYQEENEDEMEWFKQEVGLDYEIQRSDFLTEVNNIEGAVSIP